MGKTSEMQFDFDDLDTAMKPVSNVSSEPTNDSQKKLQIPRAFTTPGVHPYDEIEWEYRTASITNDKGEVLFERENVEVPKSWSQTAINIVASKYFHTYRDRNEHETSVKQPF